MVKKKFEVPDINWDLIIPEIVRAFTPFIQGVAWLGISKIDNRISAINNLIAVAEVVPGIDLGLPRGIVLAAMYDKTDEALDMINELAQAIRELPANLKEFIQKIVDETKEEIEKVIPEVPDLPDVDVPFAERQPEETWEEFIKRRLKETGLFKL